MAVFRASLDPCMCKGMQRIPAAPAGTMASACRLNNRPGCQELQRSEGISTRRDAGTPQCARANHSQLHIVASQWLGNHHHPAQQRLFSNAADSAGSDEDIPWEVFDARHQLALK